MGETRVIWNQTNTQKGLERQYRALSAVSRYLDSVSPHSQHLSELQEFQELHQSHSAEEIANALARVKARDCGAGEKMAFLNAWGIVS